MADAAAPLDTATSLANQDIAAGASARADITRRDADIEKTLGSMPTFNQPAPKLDVQPFQAPAMADPMKAWGSPTMALALIASFATRHPLTAALSSATAAINAVKSNNASAYQTAFDAWKTNTDFAFKRADWENLQYHDALDLFKTNFDQGLQKIQTLATLNKDQALLAQIQSGNIGDLVGIVNARTNALRQAQEGYEKAATVGEQISEWNDWQKQNPNAPLDDKIREHQRIFPTTASARMVSPYDAVKAASVYSKIYRANPMAGMPGPGGAPAPAYIDQRGQAAPDFDTWLQNDWPAMSNVGNNTGGGQQRPPTGTPPAKPSAALTSANLDAMIAKAGGIDKAIQTAPDDATVRALNERYNATHRTGNGLSNNVPPGAVPLTPQQMNDHDGQTYNGGKYKKQGQYAVPTGQ